MRRVLLLPFLFLSVAVFAQGGHDHHNHKKPETDQNETQKDTISEHDHEDHDMHHMEMHSFFSSSLPMNRDGSGTSWQPDVSPMFMHMWMKGNTMYMLHWNLFLRYNMQDITKVTDGRGGSKLDAPNMFMFGISHKPGEKDMVSFLSMLSLDPITVGEAGYPLLFQTGESYQGKPLVDRQHPHDLISELAVNYTHSFTKDIDLNAYFGYPGEPALGPVVFMHRLSAMSNPDAPLGHHWQDATHITFGVGTLGLRYKNTKLEGSIFTGREPGENRYDFDKPRFDSYSARVSVNPSKNLALQVSRGFIKSPELLHPGEDITRTTASAMHTHLLGGDRFIATTLAWGMNSSDENNLHSLLLESNLILKPLGIYGRYEYVQKDRHELNLQFIEENWKAPVSAVTLGVNKVLLRQHLAFISVGAQSTLYVPNSDLRYWYGKYPMAAEVYLRISPPGGHMHEH